MARLPATREARQQAALEATREVARREGLSAAGAHVLGDAHNTIVLLPDPGVVAKVATSALDKRGEDALRRELTIGLHLAARDAPIAAPLPDGTGGPHEIDGRMLTLWSYCAPERAPDQPGLELGQAMRVFHEALADFREALPPLTEKLVGAAALFADPAATPELSASDRSLTAAIYDELQPRLEDVEMRRGLHGEPHSDNVIWTRGGPVFIDFEAACLGPLEWDLAFLPEQAHAAFPERNDDLIDQLRDAISYCVAAWCWAQRGRSPEIDEAAAFHLEALRRTTRSR